MKRRQPGWLERRLLVERLWWGVTNRVLLDAADAVITKASPRD